MSETPGQYNKADDTPFNKQKSPTETTAQSFIDGVQGFHWKADYVKFCEVLGGVVEKRLKLNTLALGSGRALAITLSTIEQDQGFEATETLSKETVPIGMVLPIEQDQGFEATETPASNRTTTGINCYIVGKKLMLNNYLQLAK